MGSEPYTSDNFEQKESAEFEKTRRLYSFLVFSYIGCIALSFFSYRNYINQNQWMFYLTSFIAVTLLVNLLFYYHKKSLTLSCYIASSIIVVFCLLMTYQGGVNNTALFWIFPFPLILFVMLGREHGLYFNGFIYISLLIILTNPQFRLVDYGDVETSRFLASLLILNAFSYVNEHFRASSYAKMTDISAVKEKQANTDFLTKLPNRRFIDSVFWPQCVKDEKNNFPLVIMIGDVDHFKLVNDKYGHETGDLVLEKIARTIESNIRKTDIVARVGGEEFLMILSATGYEKGLEIAEKIRQAINEVPFDFEETTFFVSMSFGVAIAKDPFMIKKQINKADEQLYKAKDLGRNCVQ